MAATSDHPVDVSDDKHVVAGTDPTEAAPSDDNAASGTERVAPGGAAGDGAHRMDAGVAEPAGAADASPARSGRPRRGPGLTSGRPPLSVAAAINAVWAAAWSAVPMLVIAAAVTLTGPQRPPVLDVIRYGLAAWLLGHGVPLRVAGEPIGLVPLAVTAVAAWRCVRSGRNMARAMGVRRARSARPAIVLAGSVAIAYGLLGVAAAAIARSSVLDVSMLRSGVTLFGFAIVTAFLGAWADTRFARRVRRAVPYPLRSGVRTALMAVFLLLTAGAIAIGVQIAVAGATATAILRNMHLGFAADVGVVLACLAFAPNLAVWASAYLAGPGFTLGQVPELPVFAGLPERSVSGMGQLLLATPLLAGLIAGVMLARRAQGDLDREARGRRNEPIRRRTLAIAAIIAAPTAAVALGVIGLAASGSLGSGALAHTGQVGWAYALIGGLGIGIGALVGAQLAAGDE
jgi:Family of unknown function (DUF6350)